MESKVTSCTPRMGTERAWARLQSKGPGQQVAAGKGQAVLYSRVPRRGTVQAGRQKGGADKAALEHDTCRALSAKTTCVSVELGALRAAVQGFRYQLGPLGILGQQDTC